MSATTLILPAVPFASPKASGANPILFIPAASSRAERRPRPQADPKPAPASIDRVAAAETAHHQGTLRLATSPGELIWEDIVYAVLGLGGLAMLAVCFLKAFQHVAAW
jgi:hypothetical protein